VLCTTAVQSDMYTREQFLKFDCWFRFPLDLGLFFVYFLPFYSCVVCFCFVSSSLRQEIGWEEHLRNDLFCVPCVGPGL